MTKTTSYRFKNVSPLGDLDLPTHRTVVKAGDFIELTDFDEAAALYWQPNNWKATTTGVDWGKDPAAPDVDDTVAPAAADTEGAGE